MIILKKKLTNKMHSETAKLARHFAVAKAATNSAVPVILAVRRRKNEAMKMNQHVFKSYSEPLRVDLSWDERWKASDRGLITCWEVGRKLSGKKPEIAERAKNGELPVLGWKGGVEKVLKKKEKFGTLFYLAQWQGLRGDDLDIDLSEETELICSKTGMKVIYTGDIKKYGNS